MQVDTTKCNGCLQCVPYCTMGVIAKVPGLRLVEIDQAECVECGVCLRSEACTYGALYQPELTWPRILRAEFSDPLVVHPATGVGGRGTEEMKTNDVTGRYRRGRAGMAAELGRPNTGARFREVQKVAMALASIGVEFEENNPVTHLMSDRSRGLIREDVLDEKVMSAIVEFNVPLAEVPVVVAKLREVEPEVNTVFVVDMISLVEPDGTIPTEIIAAEAGIPLAPNGKNNLGMGRPLAKLFEED